MGKRKTMAWNREDLPQLLRTLEITWDDNEYMDTLDKIRLVGEAIYAEYGYTALLDVYMKIPAGMRHVVHKTWDSIGDDTRICN